MTRVAGWEEALAHAIERHGAMPFAWGVSDCFTLSADCILAVTGEDRLAAWRRYTTELGAARVLRNGGMETVEDLFARHFEDVPPSMAQRGDIGVIERDGAVSGGVFTSFGFASKAQHGVIYEPVTAVKQAFRII